MTIRASVLRWAVALCAAVAVVALVGPGRTPVSAQGPSWVFEDVAPAGNTTGNSVTMPNGLAFDPQGRLVLAWGDTCACGGYEQETWARREAGVWQFHPFLPGPPGSDLRTTNNVHAMELAGSGAPVMVFDARHAAVNAGVPDAIWSFEDDLDADPTNGLPTRFGYLADISHFSDLTFGNYATATAPGGSVRSVRFSWTIYDPRVVLEGAPIKHVYYLNPGGGYAVTPDGADHVVFSSSNFAQPSTLTYMRRDSGGLTETVMDTDAVDGTIVSGPSGTLHAFVEKGQSLYGGALEYTTSSDNGVTWSARETVDPSAVGLSAAIDRNGVPAIAYWRWGQGLFLATRANGTWQSTLAWAPTNWNIRVSTLHPRLAFDAANQPHLFFWDWTTASMRLAVLPDAAPVNHSPTANDDASATDDGVAVTLDVLGNDSDPDNDPLTITGTTPATHGTLTLNPNQTITYAPLLGYHGSDSFTYDISDAHGGTATSTVSLTINAVPLDLRLPACQVPRTDLVALWDGNGSTIDATGHGYNGVTYGGMSYRPGAEGQAFRFDGTTGYVQVDAADNAIYPGVKSFTVSAWVKTFPATAATQVIAQKSEGTGSSFVFGMMSGGLFATVSAGSSSTPVINSTSVGTAGQIISDGHYHHVALVSTVYTAAQIGAPIDDYHDLRIFVDGEEADLSVENFAGTLQDDNGQPNPLTLGASPGSGTMTNFFAGAMDDVAIYHRALTPTELQAIVATRAQCGVPDDTKPPVVTVPASSTVEAAQAGSAYVPFVTSAVDVLDGPLPVTCDATSPLSVPLTAGSGVFVTCSATDLDGNTDAQSFSVRAVDTLPPTLQMPAPITTAASSTPVVVTYAATATDVADPAPAVSCVPASGSAFATGTTTVNCTATDATGNHRSGGFTVTVPQPVVNVITVANPGPQTAYLGAAVSLQIQATDPRGRTLQFRASGPINASGVPTLGVPGLTINTSGLITGTTTSAGTFTASVVVSETGPNSLQPVSVAFSFTVINHRVPRISPLQDQTSRVGVAIRPLTVSATTDGGGIFSAVGLPDGLSIDPNRGTITGTPTGLGPFPATVVVTITDTLGLTASTAFQWRVFAPGQADLSIRGTLGVQAGGTAQHSRLMAVVEVRSLGYFTNGVAHLEARQGWTLGSGACFYSAPGSPSRIPGSPAVHPVGVRLGAWDVPFHLSGTGSDAMRCTLEGPFDALASLADDLSGTVGITGPGHVDPYLPNNIVVLSYPARTSSPGNTAPLLENPGDQQFWEGDSVSLLFNAADQENDPLAFGIVAGSLPPGLMLDTRSGSIGPLLNATSAGDYPVTVAVSDGTASANVAFTWHVGLRTVTFADPGDRSNAAGLPLRLPLQVADRAGNPITMTATGLPSGLTLRSDVARSSWWVDGTPDPQSLGTHTVTIAASSAGAPPVTHTFIWTIGPDVGPTLGNPGNQVTHGGQTVSLQLQASDPYGDPVTYGAFGLPAGMSVNAATGLISGRYPLATPGGRTITTVSATIGTHTVQQSFFWDTIRNDAPTLIRPSDQVSYAGSPLAFQLQSIDVNGDARTYSIQSTPALPASIVFDPSSGAFSGTAPNWTGASAVRTYTVSAFVTDQWGAASAPRQFTLTIDRKPFVTRVTSAASQVVTALRYAGNVGSPVSLSLVADDPDTGDVVTVTLDQLPGGVTLAGAVPTTPRRSVRLDFRGAPTAAGTFITTITVTDSYGNTASVPVTLEILPAGRTNVAVTLTGSGNGTGGRANFTAYVTNTSGLAASGVTLSIPRPAALVEGASYPRWGCGLESQNLGGVWTTGNPSTTFAGLTVSVAGLQLTYPGNVQPGFRIMCRTIPVTLGGITVPGPTFNVPSVTLAATVAASNDNDATDNSASATVLR